MTRQPASKPGVLLAGLASATLLVAAVDALEGPADRGAATGAALPQDSARCAEAEVRAFDFWIGRWTVTNPEGDTIGVNRIRPTTSGCGLLEEWEGAEGGLGTSLTAYDPGRDEWFQHWVGTGTVLKLTGGFERGNLVLTGLPRSVERDGEMVELVDRITWTPLDDDRVRQGWEISTDGGETWSLGFVGIYHPTESTRESTAERRLGSSARTLTARAPTAPLGWTDTRPPASHLERHRLRLPAAWHPKVVDCVVGPTVNQQVGRRGTASSPRERGEAP